MHRHLRLRGMATLPPAAGRVKGRAHDAAPERIGGLLQRGAAVGDDLQATASRRRACGRGSPPPPACPSRGRPGRSGTPRTPSATSPTTRSASDRSSAPRAAWTRSFGTFSPKNTTDGLSTPPQAGQSGIRKPETSASICASPSGRAAGAAGGPPSRAAATNSWFQASRTLLHVGPREARAPQLEALHLVEPAVEVDDAAAPRALVETRRRSASPRRSRVRRARGGPARGARRWARPRPRAPIRSRLRAQYLRRTAALATNSA